MSVAPMWVGSWKEPILSYVTKNDKKKNPGTNGLILLLEHLLEGWKAYQLEISLHLYRNEIFNHVWFYFIRTYYK